MQRVHVAIVSADVAIREAAARAFDRAPTTWKVTVHGSLPASYDVVVRGPSDALGCGIVFDPTAPESVIAAIESLLVRPRRSVVVVTGAGRGTGVTSVALHVAAQMSRATRTCYVDLDIEGGGGAARLGLADQETKTWADGLASPDELEKAAIPVPGGFRALLSSRGTDPGLCDDVVRRASDSFERVVVDLPFPVRDVGVTEGAATVLVVPPTVPGVWRARTLMPDLVGDRAVVIDRLGPGGEMTAAEVGRRLDCRVAVELPCTPSLRDAEDEGRLLTNGWTRWERRVARLARELIG